MKYNTEKYRIKALWVLLVFSLFTFTSHAAKIAELPEVLRPYGLIVKGGSIYVVDNIIIKIFSLKDFKFIKNIGKKGQGPGEFTFSPRIDVFDEYIFVNTWGKIILFSIKGDYISEKKLIFPIKYFRHPFLPIGENYVGMNWDYRKKSRHINIFDKDFKVKKVVYKSIIDEPPLPPRPGERVEKRDTNAVLHCWNYCVYKNKIFIGDTKKGFYFSVYDSNGTPLYEIQINIRKNEISKAFIEEFWRRKKSTGVWKEEKKYTNYVFPKYFPAYASFKINQDKMYVYTYKKKE